MRPREEMIPGEGIRWTYDDGTVMYERSDGEKEWTFPNGSKKWEYPDGKVVNAIPQDSEGWVLTQVGEYPHPLGLDLEVPKKPNRTRRGRPVDGERPREGARGSDSGPERSNRSVVELFVFGAHQEAVATRTEPSKKIEAHGTLEERRRDGEV